ncbi:MAG: 4Fe-4S dicluster domain-containing protein [Rhodoferax sp.]|nr:4Fe-4S dicluster domain-containing protein [Betaproteobacteria bacterium]NCN98049.1 4Fe-4S dicluster domain-containing protein [Rhodoferax sp.]PIZ21509.1 MAG: 4Fe-4S ferredoxin [Comamonadaceae bacterium CG_4_10_14_0_8_um_filter_57_29]PJC21429.1 MAG: 4Fe-4S ferredoxin [Comamonadaceae bacterium CG_4_9_14_0_8_um_filter_57_21]NCP81000.1 4Fe-4S dicluster domain-containing protein [Rhodoferax sp.]
MDPERCTGCGWCVAACRLHLLSLEPQGWRKHSVIHDQDSCTGCEKCEVRCLFNAIQVTRAMPPKPPSTNATCDPQQAPAVLS